jgi:hypothetical protein
MAAECMSSFRTWSDGVHAVCTRLGADVPEPLLLLLLLPLCACLTCLPVQSMLEAKQKAEAALNKLHQRMSSKAAQPDTNPFLVAPAVEQLPAQLPAAAAAEAAAGTPGGAGPSAAAAAAPVAATAAQNGSSISAAAAAEQQQAVQLHQQQPQQQQQQPLAAAAEVDDEDALFEQAAVLKAFSSILPASLIAKELRGSLQEQQQQQDQQAEQQRKQQQDSGIVEEQPMEVDLPGAAAADGAADDAVDDGSWLGWKQQQQQQQGSAAGAGSAAAGPAALAEAEVLRFGIDSLAAGRRAALSLAGGKGPQDAYEQQAKQQGRVAGVGGARQRKSKYDADPKIVQAEGILNLGPEAVFNAVGGMHDMWDTGNGME